MARRGLLSVGTTTWAGPLLQAPLCTLGQSPAHVPGPVLAVPWRGGPWQALPALSRDTVWSPRDSELMSAIRETWQVPWAGRRPRTGPAHATAPPPHPAAGTSWPIALAFPAPLVPVAPLPSRPLEWTPRPPEWPAAQASPPVSGQGRLSGMPGPPEPQAKAAARLRSALGDREEGGCGDKGPRPDPRGVNAEAPL